ncbi:MAG: efflux RND transporter periplasmic adaptor subunit [Verrucomicrobiales bacterium]|nr:efflux RND transporter periplasmic adaptor subunit [Verrucomicrobiales bacterium]
MKLIFRILAPLVIVVLAILLARFFVLSKPEARTFEMPPQVTKVEATRIKPQAYQIFLETQGTIRPRTTTNLIPEVSGRVVEVSPNFRDGGFFEEGEVLLKLDPVNYETAVIVDEGAIAEAKRQLHEERIRGEQALENWRRLGKSGEPSDFVSRKPQLAEAEARLRAAEAQLELAKRDLERTEVKAPFAGRIIEQNVDVGQFVNSNTQLGRAFSTDIMEVRLPLTNRQLEYVNLPDEFRGDAAPLVGPEVAISGRLGQNLSQWSGRVVRVDSSIDEASRQLFVVAEIEDPYRREEGRTGFPLKIGMFVDAMVKGRNLEQVFVIPRKAVRVGGEVIVIDGDNRIRRQEVFPIWSEEDKVVIPISGAGLDSGDVVCLTPLAYPANGALVLPTIDGVTPEVESPAGGPGAMPFTKGGKGKEGKGKGKKSKEAEVSPQKS